MHVAMTSTKMLIGLQEKQVDNYQLSREVVHEQLNVIYGQNYCKIKNVCVVQFGSMLVFKIRMLLIDAQ